MISENPVLVGGSTAFLVTLFYVSANALWYQPYPHKGAFFTTRTIEHFADAGTDEPVTTIKIERPATAPVPALVKPDPTVLKVQGVLKDLGFYSGTVDGISGPATQKAVDAYRQKVGLPSGGAIDAALLDQLGASPTTGAIVPSPAPRAPAGGKANPLPQAAQNADARIVKIQAGLKAFGNDDIKLDGVIGARTKAAIKEFQSLFGLPETGEPDQVVYAKMREIGLTD
jgi:peptidoglycan hydrolase-like protein with peptidoglycan-binding domain